MMLFGDGPLTLPAYTGKLPAVLTVTCRCLSRYVVLTGVADAGAQLVRQEAERRGAIFVDAKSEPFKLCVCGQALDFTASDGVAALVM